MDTDVKHVIASHEATLNTSSISHSPRASVATENDTYDRAEWRLFFGLCPSLFLLGWNDGTVGPLLPRMQAKYDLNYTLVSMIFIGSTVGFLIGALLNMHLNRRFGSGFVLVLGAAISVIAFVLEAIAPPFPVFVSAWALNGIGLSLQDAQANALVATLQRRPALKMGLFQAIYGTGALIAPLVATQFSELPKWHLHFLIGAGIALFNVGLVLKVTKLRMMDEILGSVGIAPTCSDDDPQGKKKSNTLKRIVTIPAVHMLTALLFIYVGVAVTLGSWIVTYLQEVRGGDSSAGYVSAGLFGGLAVGRIILIWPTMMLGPRISMLICCALCIGLQCVVWFVPSLIGNALAESLVGFFLAPMYPMAMKLCATLIPRELLAGAIGWIAGLGGTSGSALFPFMAGAIASLKGIEVIQPIAVAMISALFLLWAIIPTRKKRGKRDIELSEQDWQGQTRQTL